MKVLIKGDSHFGCITDGVDRSEEIYETYREIIRIARKFEVDYLIDLGDLFDRAVRIEDSGVLYAVRIFRLLNRQRFKSFIVIGNHDITNKAGKKSKLDAFKLLQYQNVKVIDEIDYHTDGEFFFSFYPYLNKNYLKNVKETTLEVYMKGATEKIIKEITGGGYPTKKSLVFSHMNFDKKEINHDGMNFNAFMGQQLPGGELSSYCNYFYFGHIHLNIDDPKNRLSYVGGTNYLSTAEARKPKYVYLYDDGKMKKLKLKTPRKFTVINLDFTEDEDLKENYLDKIKESETDDAFVFVLVKVHENDLHIVDTDEIKKLLTGAYYVRNIVPKVVKLKRKRMTELKNKKSKLEIAKEYILQVKPKNQDEIIKRLDDIVKEG